MDRVDADGHLPDIAPDVLMDGDDIGKWPKQQNASQLVSGRRKAENPSTVSPGSRPSIP
ncbi:hypothetical protein ACWC3X_43675 [Streptomyces populi]